MAVEFVHIAKLDLAHDAARCILVARSGWDGFFVPGLDLGISLPTWSSGLGFDRAIDSSSRRTGIEFFGIHLAIGRFTLAQKSCNSSLCLHTTPLATRQQQILMNILMNEMLSHSNKTDECPVTLDARDWLARPLPVDLVEAGLIVTLYSKVVLKGALAEAALERGTEV